MSQILGLEQNEAKISWFLIRITSLPKTKKKKKKEKKIALSVILYFLFAIKLHHLCAHLHENTWLFGAWHCVRVLANGCVRAYEWSLIVNGEWEKKKERKRCVAITGLAVLLVLERAGKHPSKESAHAGTECFWYLRCPCANVNRFRIEEMNGRRWAM